MDKQNRLEKSENLGGGVGIDSTFKEKDWYKNKIIDMVKQINNEKYIKMIYGYVRSAYREEKNRD